jgi:hypothetical protein
MSILRRFGLIESFGQPPKFAYSGEPFLDMENYDKLRAQATPHLEHLISQVEEVLADSLRARAEMNRVLLGLDVPDWEPYKPDLGPSPEDEEAAVDALALALRTVSVATHRLAMSMAGRLSTRRECADLSAAIEGLWDAREKHAAAVSKMRGNR